MRLAPLLRRGRPGLRSALGATLGTALVAGLLAAGTTGATAQAAPQAEPQARLTAEAGNPVTPGTFTGRAFDQCETVSESAMRTWRRHSPYRGVGVYISGDSRFCKTQRNLTASWVSNQLADGWRIMPITLGPQASCSTRFPRYSRSIDPTINPSSAGSYAAARAQGRAEATEAVSVARRLGIVPGSTLFYDLEAFTARTDSACTQSALWFTHAWTVRLHELRYASGFYSSAASGIRMLDDQRVRAASPFRLPDQIWLADWDGRRNTSSKYIRSDGWQDGGRAKQYLGGHNERYGGVTINIDSNWLELRTPRLPGAGAPAPVPAPAPSGPRHTGADLTDARCTPATINRLAYRRTSPTQQFRAVPLQCLLKQQRLYPYEVTGRWNPQTTTALNALQRQLRRPVAPFVSRNVWTSLLVRGHAAPVMGSGSRGADVKRLQRALNAATDARLTVTSTWDAPTARAVVAYKRKVGLVANARTTPATWKALTEGRI